MIIALDFDGVIIKRPGFPRPLEFISCEPIKDALLAIKWLINEKHQVYILTGRTKEDWRDIKKWLNKWGFPRLEITNVKKAKTAIYIDDRCLRFTNWLDVCKYLG